MIDIDLKEIALAVNGRMSGCRQHQIINHVVTDSRKIQPVLEADAQGTKKILFVALKGERVDGNELAEAAFRSGAAAVLVSTELSIEAGVPQIIVEDTAVALKQLAKYYRQQFDMPVIGVTGSTGKTSTKEMIASVLSQRYQVHKTLMNFNNEIGLPLTVLELEKTHQVSVLEMGMDKFGEIECLVDIARPSIGAITNIGTAHIENLGSRQNILKAKLEMTTWFNKDSLLIVNADDDCLSGITTTEYRLKRISINSNKAADYHASDIRMDTTKGVDFKCNWQGEIHDFRLNVPGKHNVYNALVSIAIADELGLALEQVKAGIEAFRPVGQRMNILELDRGITIINDCYNANPDSMKAAIDVLSAFQQRRRVAVLGDMYELGSYTEEAHRLIGEYALQKCDLLIAVGESASYLYQAAKEQLTSVYFKTKEEASSYLKSILMEKDVVLIKASRGMKMEEITNTLIEAEDGKRVEQ